MLPLRRPLSTVGLTCTTSPSKIMDLPVPWQDPSRELITQTTKLMSFFRRGGGVGPTLNFKLQASRGPLHGIMYVHHLILHAGAHCASAHAIVLPPGVPADTNGKYGCPCTHRRRSCSRRKYIWHCRRCETNHRRFRWITLPRTCRNVSSYSDDPIT